MRNNFEERFEQARKQSSGEVVTQALENGSPLSFVNPTEIVDLPSGGRFYPEGHPLKDKNHVEIRQMTAKEEDILTNKSFIRKGIMIDRLIESLLVDKSIPVSTLLVGDKNAIMVAARTVAYGPSYDVSLNCRECGDKNLVSIDLMNIKIRDTAHIFEELSGDETLNFNQLESGNIVIELPKTKWLVECKLMDGNDERKILSTVEMKKKHDSNAELSLSEQLEIIIVGINNVYDTNIIKQAIGVMPAYDAKHLRTLYTKLIPNVQIEKTFSCSSCLEEQEVEVPFTQEFFWPK